MLKKKIRTLTYYQQPKLQRKNCRNPLPALNLYLNSEMISQTTTLLLTSLVPRWCWCFSNAYRILHVHFFPVTENFWKKDVLNLSTGSVSRHSHKPLLDPKTHEKKQVFSPKDTGFYHPYKWRFWASHGVVEPLLPGLGLHFGLLHDATEKFQRDDLQAEDGGQRLGA